MARRPMARSACALRSYHRARFHASLGRKLPRYGGEGASTWFFRPRPSWRLLALFGRSLRRFVAKPLPLLAFALALAIGFASLALFAACHCDLVAFVILSCFSCASTLFLGAE